MIRKCIEFWEKCLYTAISCKKNFQTNIYLFNSNVNVNASADDV